MAASNHAHNRQGRPPGISAPGIHESQAHGRTSSGLSSADGHCHSTSVLTSLLDGDFQESVLEDQNKSKFPSVQNSQAESISAPKPSANVSPFGGEGMDEEPGVA